MAPWKTSAAGALVLAFSTPPLPRPHAHRPALSVPFLDRPSPMPESRLACVAGAAQQRATLPGLLGSTTALLGSTAPPPTTAPRPRGRASRSARPRRPFRLGSLSPSRRSCARAHSRLRATSRCCLAARTQPTGACASSSRPTRKAARRWPCAQTTTGAPSPGAQSWCCRLASTRALATC